MKDYLNFKCAGFCKSFDLEKRKKRELSINETSRTREMHKRKKREEMVTEEEILRRSYKTNLG